jgi:hypothetical protein
VAGGADPIIPYYRALEQIARQQTELQKRIATLVAPTFRFDHVARAAEAAFQTSERLSKHLFEPVVQLVERLEGLQEAERRALSELAPRGWLISPSLRAGAPVEILKSVEENGIDEVERQLVEVFDADFCEKALMACCDRPSFKRWESKLMRAMAAHRRGEYDLAIPIWLAATDRILSSELSTKDRRIDDVFTSVQKRGGRRIKEAFGTTGPWGEPLLDALIEVLRTFGRRRDDESPNPVLRRHAIMHGEDPNFGSERDSIQCVLALEVVHLYLELRDGPDEAVAS